jgi:hypothetical protein
VLSYAKISCSTTTELDKHCLKMAEKGQWCRHSTMNSFSVSLAFYDNLLHIVHPGMIALNGPVKKRKQKLITCLSFILLVLCALPCILNLSTALTKFVFCQQNTCSCKTTINVGYKVINLVLFCLLNYPWVLILPFCADGLAPLIPMIQ